MEGNESRVHECVHDDLGHDSVKATNIPYENHPYDKSRMKRRLGSSSSQASSDSSSSDDSGNENNDNNNDKSDGNGNYNNNDDSYEYIRIRPYYDEIESVLSGDDLSYIKSVVSAAIRYFESFMKVVPIHGTFHLPRKCYAADPTLQGYENCLYDDLICGNVTLPADHLDSGYLYDHQTETATKLPRGSGVKDTDFILYVTYSNKYCGTYTLAWATQCAQDQYGRPIAGTINFCKITLDDSKLWREDVIIALHEITHTLIMSPSLWDDFIDNNGNPIAFENVYTTKTMYHGDEQAFLITNKVKELAQLHYGCYDESIMPGLPLEDDGGSGSVSSHWESHHVYSEYMGPTLLNSLIYVSEFTLALMEDSGWYKVDYNYAEPFYFGHNEGCDWFTTDCVDKDSETSNWPQYYCVDSTDNGCSADYASVAYCLIYDDWGDDIPQVFRYYDDPSKGGNSFLEYCAVRRAVDDPDTGFEEICWDTTPAPSDVSNPYHGITYGLTSRCVDTTSQSGEQRGYCFKHECYDYNANSDEWAGVYISMSDSEIIDCNRDDELTEKSSLDTGLTITCPDIDAICRNKKPFSCYWGYYNDDLDECVCHAGYTGTECETEDRDHVSGVELGLAQDTPAPTIAENHLCIKGVPASTQVLKSWNTDEWEYVGLYNYFPKYVYNDYYGFEYKVEWDIYNHMWTIVSDLENDINLGYDVTFAYCAVSEWTSDISECNGHWYIYDLPTSKFEFKLHETMVTYFGLCNSTDAPSNEPSRTPTPVSPNNPGSSGSSQSSKSWQESSKSSKSSSSQDSSSDAN